MILEIYVIFSFCDFLNLNLFALIDEDYRENGGILSDGDITDTQIVNDADLLDRGVIEDILIDSDISESETSSSECSCSIH